jgi:NAD(P)-dependent dehydrogenase (short-subunit alcohol dehydrogenase family)
MAHWSSKLPRGCAIVTGGAGDLGRPLVRALAESGLAVASLDLVSSEDASLSLDCDVTEPDAVARAVATVTDRLGPVGALVCAAGLQSEHELADLQPEEFHRILDASLTSAFLVARETAPHLTEGAAIVAFSSGLGTRGMLHGPHYAAAKAGVVGLVKSLALELGPRGIRANAVAPGPIRSRMLDGLDPGRASARGVGAIALGRVGEPDDVVGPVLFLLSDVSRFVTGAVLHVNGGMLMP